MFTFRLADAATLNTLLLPELLAERATDPGVRRSVVGPGWHGRRDFFAATAPASTRLQGHIVHALREATRRVSPAFPFARWALRCEGWVNVLGPGAAHTPHVHPAHHWSGVYYVAVPPSTTTEAGALELLDPRTSVGLPGIEGAACFADTRTLVPEAGQLVVFPSYLRHWVAPAAPGGDRVTVAFNGRWDVARPTRGSD